MVMMTEKKIALVDLDRGGQNRGAACRQRLAVGWLTRRVMREMAEDVLHHDDGAVDDDAEIDGADRQQIGGIPRAAP